MSTPSPPDDVMRAHYFSTYCIHGHHADCRLTCKFCDKPCRCDCHATTEAPPMSTPTVTPEMAQAMELYRERSTSQRTADLPAIAGDCSCMLTREAHSSDCWTLTQTDIDRHEARDRKDGRKPPPAPRPDPATISSSGPPPLWRRKRQ